MGAFDGFYQTISKPDTSSSPRPYDSAYTQYFNANQGRYNQLVAGYAQRAQALSGMLDTIGQNQLSDAKDAYQQNAAAGSASAISRGLYNTTIQDSLQKGALDQHNRNMNQINTNIANQKTQIMGDASLAALQNIYNRNDTYQPKQQQQQYYDNTPGLVQAGPVGWSKPGGLSQSALDFSNANLAWAGSGGGGGFSYQQSAPQQNTFLQDRAGWNVHSGNDWYYGT